MARQTGGRVYLDYASATPPLKKALFAMRKAEKLIGNPGGIHEEAVQANEALQSARENIARELGCKAREVIFTSGLTESINSAIIGYATMLARSNSIKGTHWIVSSIEHAAVLECFAEIERLGGTVSFIDPDSRGRFLPPAVLQAVRDTTVLVSIGWANNEIGVVQPLTALSREIKKRNPRVRLHADAGQAPLYLSPQVHSLGVDLFSLGSNKLYGPHGVGALYARHDIELAPLMHGGGQERGLRAGTENVALAVGFSQAFSLIASERAREERRLRELRGRFVRDISALIPDVAFNTDLTDSLPHMLNISIPEIESEYVALFLDKEGIAISTKSACAEGSARMSHVVEALGEPLWRASHTLRFSLGRETTARGLQRTAHALAKAVRAGKSGRRAF